MSWLVLSASLEYVAVLLVYGHYKYFTLSALGSTLESDVYRRRILASKVGPRTERVKHISLLVTKQYIHKSQLSTPYSRYSISLHVMVNTYVF